MTWVSSIPYDVALAFGRYEEAADAALRAGHAHRGTGTGVHANGTLCSVCVLWRDRHEMAAAAAAGNTILLERWIELIGADGPELAIPIHVPPDPGDIDWNAIDPEVLRRRPNA